MFGWWGRWVGWCRLSADGRVVSTADGVALKRWRGWCFGNIWGPKMNEWVMTSDGGKLSSVGDSRVWRALSAGPTPPHHPDSQTTSTATRKKGERILYRDWPGRKRMHRGFIFFFCVIFFSVSCIRSQWFTLKRSKHPCELSGGENAIPSSSAAGWSGGQPTVRRGLYSHLLYVPAMDGCTVRGPSGMAAYRGHWQAPPRG